MKNKKVIICLLILCIIVFILGMHGGSEYYFCDFCVHKTLNMFYNNGSPDFFKKPNFVSDLQAIFYWLFYVLLKYMHLVDNLDNIVRLFTNTTIATPAGNISFMFPALLINNIFSALGVCFTFLTTYILTNKKIIPSFIAGFTLATTYIWMNFTHHLTVDIPLSALCIVTIFYTIYFINDKRCYSIHNTVILGILSGLCLSTKYNGLLVAIAPIIVLFVTRESLNDFFKKIAIFLLVITYTFIITNPYIVINFYNFTDDFSFEYNHAFNNGHYGFDDSHSLLFYIFHNIPNAIGNFLYLCSIIGLILFCNDKNIPEQYKYAFLLFPITFLIFMCFSSLIFLRYILPVIPFLTVLAGVLVNFILEQKSHKFIKKIGILVITVLLIQNSVNAIHFYNIMSTNDTRVDIKEICKILNIGNTKVSTMYTYRFSNAYYVEDFTGMYSDLKSDVKSYLECACKNCRNVSPMILNTMFNEYDVIILDSTTFDRMLYTSKYENFSKIDSQYFMYTPNKVRKFQIKKSIHPLYVVQINPYKYPKECVPFDALRADFKYRTARGPFVEIYFRNKNLRDDFVKQCDLNSIICKSVEIENSYYYKNFEKEPDGKIDGINHE